jgi:hypothetical protein
LVGGGVAAKQRLVDAVMEGCARWWCAWLSCQGLWQDQWLDGPFRECAGAFIVVSANVRRVGTFARPVVALALNKNSNLKIYEERTMSKTKNDKKTPHLVPFGCFYMWWGAVNWHALCSWVAMVMCKRAPQGASRSTSTTSARTKKTMSGRCTWEVKPKPI